VDIPVMSHVQEAAVQRDLSALGPAQEATAQARQVLSAGHMHLARLEDAVLAAQQRQVKHGIAQ